MATTSRQRPDPERQPLDRLDPDSSAALAHPLGVVVGGIVGEARPPQRAVDEDLADRARAARGRRRWRRPGPRARSATGALPACTAFETAKARPPPSSTATAITTGTETSNALESVSNSSRPDAASATTPTAPTIPCVSRCASAMISAIPITSSAIPTAVTGSCAVP